MTLGWLIASLFMAISIIGLPWASAGFTMAKYSFSPFGSTIVKSSKLTGKEGILSGNLGLAANIIWFVFAGWWLALGHILSAIITACTIIGIPFAWQHIKLAGTAFAPVGKAVVTTREAKLLG